jgi:YD repeat-containing protein
MYLAEADHLGSLTGLTDTAGAYVERYSYDPWGRRRNPTDWSFNSVPSPGITDRGFAGHEHYSSSWFTDQFVIGSGGGVEEEL